MVTSALLFFLLQAPAAPSAPAAQPAGTELLQVRHVYLLPMSHSFEQYLANHLTRSGVYQVVTDPAKADAIFTDRLGKSFEAALDELYPAAKPEEPKHVEEKPDDQEPPQDSVMIPIAPQERLGGGSKGRNTYFLVNRATRNVIWSTYERSKTSQADDLNYTAKDVVARLESAVRNDSKSTAGKKGWHPW